MVSTCKRHLKTIRLKIVSTVLAFLVFTVSDAQPAIDVEKTLSDAALQYKGMLASHSDVTKFPQSLKPDGTQNDRTSDWWCSGFFGGSLWYLFEATGDTAWKVAAHKWSMAVEKEKYNKGTHDLGFMLYCPFGNGYRLTKNEQYKDIMLTGAQSLATRFNASYGVIESWDGWKGFDYPVIIDNMMNLEFLFWAAKASGDKKLYDICISHADHTLKNHFRKDGSSYHVVCYGQGGKVLKQATHQGLADSSAWARGQAWGLYGYTVMYRETGDKKYLTQAEKIAAFILNHPNLPKDKIPYWDYDAPGEERDASAGAVAASALLELSQYSKKNKNQYFDAAATMLSSLGSPAYKSAIGGNGNFLLMHSVGSKPHKSEVNTPLVYADYYYLEALLRYKKLSQQMNRQSTGSTASKGSLLFQNGFEGTSCIIRNAKPPGAAITTGYAIDDIEGVDKTAGLKSDWVKDLDQSPEAGLFFFEYTGGDSTQRNVNIIPEPGNEKNHVMQFWLADSWHASEGQQKARVQASLYNIKKGLKEFYQSVRVFLSEDFSALKRYPQTIPWCTISEFWNNEWWVKNEPYGFRVTLGIGKPVVENSELYFILEAENAGQKLVWRADYKTSTIAVPIGKWFTMDYYFKEGNEQTGRFYLAITPDGGRKQVVYDVHNFTHNTADPAPNGVTGYNPMKLYTSKDVIGFIKDQGKTLRIYWDDFKLWRNKEPD